MATGDHDWTTGEQVTAQNMDDFLQLQVVGQYATSAARDTALSARKREGMLAYSIDEDRVYIYSGSAWVRVDHSSATGRTGGVWRRVAAQSINTATATLISWDTEDSDSDSFLTPTGGSLVVPSGLGGLYLITAEVTMASAALGQNALRITVSGITDPYEFAGTTLNGYQAATICVPMPAATTFEVRTTHNNGSAVNTTRARLDVYRIGA